MPSAPKIQIFVDTVGPEITGEFSVASEKGSIKFDSKAEVIKNTKK